MAASQKITLDVSKLYGFRILGAAGEDRVALAAKLGFKKVAAKIGAKRLGQQR